MQGREAKDYLFGGCSLIKSMHDRIYRNTGFADAPNTAFFVFADNVF